MQIDSSVLSVDGSDDNVPAVVPITCANAYRVVQAADEIGIYAIEVGAKDDAAPSFYAKYG